MERLCFAMHIFALFIFVSPYSLASIEILLHCDPGGSNYQVSFHPEAGGILATQRHKGLGKYSNIDQEIKVTNFRSTMKEYITPSWIAILKSVALMVWYFVTISPVNIFAGS